MAAALMNARTRAPVADAVELAVTRRSRRRGLLGRDGLDAGAALLLEPCAAVHTAFMRFPIDLVFVDRDGRAVKIVKDVPPWRIALSPGARAVIEMAGGSLRRVDLLLGDRLYVLPPSDSTGKPSAGRDWKTL
jgi:uncharacterized membrane protein (UPF0127 family)